MNLKQLFCTHIWKAISAEFIRIEREQLTNYSYANYAYYAMTYKCVVCDKSKTEEEKTIVL